MKVAYSRLAEGLGSDSPTYWQHFGTRLADLAAIPQGAKVLDVGTGSGSVLLPATERAGETGLGVGIDINPRWFEKVQAEIERRGLKNISLAQMDAASLDFPGGQFDRALCGFVGWSYCFDFEMQEFTGPDTRLAEISRVLKAGGRVGISSWSKQEDLDWLGEQFRRYLPEYVADHEEEDIVTVYSRENAMGLERILRAGGFQEIAITAETAAFVSRDEEEWWLQMWGAGWKEYIDRVACTDTTVLKQFKERVFENLQPHREHDGIHFAKSVLFAFGSKL
ncbi:MAG: methyltransferase domain-containing protein [bacterium]